MCDRSRDSMEASADVREGWGVDRAAESKGWLEDSGRRAMARGLETVRRAPAGRKWIVGVLFLLALTFLPVGRRGPAENPRSGGGLWKPVSVDSGELFRLRVAIDFFSTYEAGWRILNGRDPYSVIPRADGLSSPGDRAPYFTRYRYLPFPALAIGVPMNALPPWTAYALWVALNFALLILNFLLTVGRRPAALVPLALIWFAWFPLAVELYMGQFTFLMTTLLLWGLDGLGRGTAGGAWCWGGSVALKIYSVLMAPALWVWGYRRTAGIAVAGIGLATAGWFLARPGSWALFNEMNLERRWVAHERQPYAGAQGMQEAVNATAWALSGRDMARGYRDGEAGPAVGADPVAWGTGLLMAGYLALLGWAVWKTRRAGNREISRGDAEARRVGLPLENRGVQGAAVLFWLSWLYLYGDCWEHHTVLAQGAMAWWVSRGGLRGRHAALAWLGAGAPSLWLGFSGAMAGGDGAAATLYGLMYFWQRPLGIAFVTLLAARAVWDCGMRIADCGNKAASTAR